MERGKFAGRIGRVCEYAVYFEGNTTLLYRGKEVEPCFESQSYEAAEKFAGVIGYRQTARGPMPLYADSW
jgi:hypothetical protein